MNFPTKVSINSPLKRKPSLFFHTRSVLHSLLNQPEDAICSSSHASCSGMGSVFFHEPPSFESGYLNYPSSCLNAETRSTVKGNESKLMTTAWPSPFTSVRGYLSLITFFTSWRSFDCPLPS